MAEEQKPASSAGEATPLLPVPAPPSQTRDRSVLYKALLCGCFVSLAFGITQVPLIYVFRLMTCEAYYDAHPEPARGIDRCGVPEIEASTARAVALLGFSTTLFGILNLFVTGWTIRRFGLKVALLIQVFFPALRLAVQTLGVLAGSTNGILIVQCSQIITIVGGPTGYVLALNSFVAEIVGNRERTGALGQLQGSTMFGTSIGFLAGGVLSDLMNITAPFKVAFVSFLACCLYVVFFLPWVPKQPAQVSVASKGLTRFFGPLKMFAPQKWIGPDGRLQTEYGALLLGVGAFLGVLATGYIPILLQMYSTDVYGFGTSENGALISLYSMLRGVFLTLAFPKLISRGRKWLDGLKEFKRSRKVLANNGDCIPDLPKHPDEFPITEGMEPGEEPVEPPKPNDESETYAFDLLYVKYSLIADGILTGAATFVKEGWQIYLVAAMLPFAAGTGSASKGTMLQMCPPSERTEALSAITLLDNIARLSTTSLFGVIFAVFADLGKPHLVFLCNAGVALLGLVALLPARFPREGSRRL